MNILNNIKKNTIFLLIITIIILYIVLKDDLNDILLTFQKIDLRFILLAIAIFFLSIGIKGYINYLIVNDKEKVDLKESIKHNIITQFFNGITPFATGGQPMEIYMLKEHGISLTKATNYTIQSFLFYQVALVIFGILAVTYNSIFHIFPKVKLLQNLVLLGFIVNTIVVIILLLLSYSKKMTESISNICIKLAKKMKLKIKEEDLRKKFEDYNEGLHILKKRKKLFAVGVFLNIISLFCLYSIPLFIAYSMHDVSLSLTESITSSAYVYIMASFVPIPGSSGGIEYGFTQFFGNFISINQISAMLLLWRTITYYIGIIIGGIVFNLEKR